MLLEIFAIGTVLGFVSPKEGFFWHVTDLHYDPTYWTDRRSCNSHNVPTHLGVYGDFWCDSPWRLIQDSIDVMASVHGGVDFILWTGDNVAHIEDKYNTNEGNMVVVGNLTDALKKAFPHVKIYATMGNHDWHPTDQYLAQPAFMYQATAEMWKDWIVEEAQLDNFRKAGYYTVKTAHGLRIVEVNSMLYFSPNKETKNLEDPAGQFAWLTSVLEAAKQNKEKVLLITHISPGFKVPGNLLWYDSHFQTRFLDIVDTYSDVITSIHCGHYHIEQYRLLEKTDGSAGVPIFIAPSLTPWRYKEGDEADQPHNPAIRLVRYKRKTGVILDIEQYYMDLTKSNEDNASDWKVEYKATHAYDVEDLSARSLQKMIKNIGKEDKYLDKYIRYNTVLANGDTTVKNCDDTCRAEHVCAMSHLTTDSFDGCVTTRVGGKPNWTSINPAVIIGAALVIIALVWNVSGEHGKKTVVDSH